MFCLTFTALEPINHGQSSHNQFDFEKRKPTLPPKPPISPPCSPTLENLQLSNVLFRSGGVEMMPTHVKSGSESSEYNEGNKIPSMEMNKCSKNYKTTM